MRRISALAAFLLLIVAAPFDALAQQGGGYYGRHMMWDGGWYGMFFGPLFMIVFIAAVIVVVVLIVRWLGGSGQGAAPPRHSSPGREPLDILKERFARGEIDKEEYEERRRLLAE